MPDSARRLAVAPHTARRTKTKRSKLERSWYAANAARKREYATTWKAANRRRATDTENRRRAQVAVHHVKYEDVWARDRGICWLCKRPIDPALRRPDMMAGSIDHVVPISRGGEHAMSNVALAHMLCNVRKGDRLVDRIPAALAVG